MGECTMVNTIYRGGSKNRKDNGCDGPLEACPRCRKPVCERHNRQSMSRCQVPSICLPLA